jgi:hypothetical protein
MTIDDLLKQDSSSDVTSTIAQIPVTEDDQATLAKLRTAAQFFGCLNLREYAFQLFQHVWSEGDPSCLKTADKLLLLAEYVESASSPSERQVVQKEVLSQLQLASEVKELCVPQQLAEFLLWSFFVSRSCRSSDSLADRAKMHSQFNQDFVMKAISALPKANRQLDFLTYLAAIRAIPSRNFNAIGQVQDQFLEKRAKRPGPRLGNQIAATVRKLLDWCMDQLLIERTAHRPWWDEINDVGVGSDADRLLVLQSQIFCALWPNWRISGATMIPSDWGMSREMTLRVCTSFIADILVPSGFDPPTTWTTRTSLLGRLPDSALARLLLDRFTWLNGVTQNRSLSVWTKLQLSSLSRPVIQRELQVDLTRILEAASLIRKPKRLNEHLLGLRNRSTDPSLAPSLSSGSSFRRFKDSAIKQLQLSDIFRYLLGHRV